MVTICVWHVRARQELHDSSAWAAFNSRLTSLSLSEELLEEEEEEEDDENEDELESCCERGGEVKVQLCAQAEQVYLWSPLLVKVINENTMSHYEHTAASLHWDNAL